MATAQSASKSWYIRGGRIVDPATGRDEVADLFMKDGLIVALPANPPREATVVDGTGLIVAPGLIDLHVHLREPGGENAETVESGSAAAAHGGFTTIVSMPNTNPAIDGPEQIRLVQRLAAASGLAKVLPTGCITSRRKGHSLADLEGMAAAGAVAFTDDGATVADTSLMRSAMKAARQLGIPVMEHALDQAIAGNGVMHEGACSKALNLPGIPSAAETEIVRRDIELAAETGCAVHIQHVSAAGSIEAIQDAIVRGLPVSCEVTPHHIALCDADVRIDNTATKVSPPLGSLIDRDSLRNATKNGIIRAFATDHAPHTASSKDSAFIKAPFGMTGLETAVGVTYTFLAKAGIITLGDWLRLWTTGPAGILNRPLPSLNTGCPADVVLLDLESGWTVRSCDFLSKSSNSPFQGRELTGSSVLTICDGRLTWDAGTGRIDKRARP